MLASRLPSVHGAEGAAGHNKTRPPPLMGWRGPRPACRTSLAGCPACPAATAGHQGQTPARITGFPALPTSSRVSPRAAPVSGGESISTPEPSDGARGRELFIESFFVVNRTLAVIRNRMRLSTASFTGYPQVASCLPAAGAGARALDDRARLPEGASPAGAAVAAAAPSATPGLKLFRLTTTRENTPGVFSRL